MSKKSSETHKNEIARINKVIDKNFASIVSREGVISIGVGHKTTGGVRTDQLCIVVHVSAKRPNIPERNRIPEFIDDIPTDVVELLPYEDETDFDDPPSMPARDVVMSDVSTLEPVRGERLISRGDPPAPAASVAPVASARGTTSSRGESRFPWPMKPATPLQSGVPIQNPKTGEFNVGMLGAIVFDKSTGKPMGLTAAHVIGSQKSSKRATAGKDPIFQPPGKTDAINQIGILKKFDTEFDAALFDINFKQKHEREVDPKVWIKEEELKTKRLPKGKKELELGSPTEAINSMRVECPGRWGYVTGVVRDIQRQYFMMPNGTLKMVKKIFIDFDGPRTYGGDSGALWLERDTGRPIGLHRGVRWFSSVDSYGYESKFARAYATCITQLSKDFYPFTFKKPQTKAVTRGPKTLPKKKPITKNPVKLESLKCQTSLVETKNGYTCFCFEAGKTNTLIVKEFDKNLLHKRDIETGISPASGVSAARQGSSVYAVWRTTNQDRLELAAFSEKTGKFQSSKLLAYKSKQKPSLTCYFRELVIAYTNPITSRVNIRYCDIKTGKWRSHEIANLKTKFAPALARFGNSGLVICWIDSRKNRICKADLFYLNARVENGEYVKGQFRAYNLTYVGKCKSWNDPALATGDGKLFLAYSTRKQEVEIFESSDCLNWKRNKKLTKAISGPPSLSYVNGKLICHRPKS